jgi:hypothetical protein
MGEGDERQRVAGGFGLAGACGQGTVPATSAESGRVERFERVPANESQTSCGWRS